MQYMAVPVSFRWDEELVARIDMARGDVPRSRWVRRAVEQALAGDERATATAWWRACLDRGWVTSLPAPVDGEDAEQALADDAGGAAGSNPAPIRPGSSAGERSVSPPTPAEQPGDAEQALSVRQSESGAMPPDNDDPAGPSLAAAPAERPRIRPSTAARPFRPIPKKEKT